MSKLDQHFKSMISDHSGSVPDDMWSKIEKELYPEKSKRPIFWILLVAGLMAISATLYYFLKTDQNEAGNQVSALNLEAFKPKVVAEFTESKIQNTTKIEENKDVRNQPALISKTRTQVTKRELSQVGTSINSVSIQDGVTNKELVEFTTDSKEFLKEIVNLPMPKLNSIHSYKEEYYLMKMARRSNKNRTECPSFSKEVAGVMLDLYYSSEFGLRSFGIQNGNDAVNEYMQLREKTESSLYSFSAGLRVAIMLPINAGLKTGFNYSQINEKFTYEDPNSRQVKYIKVIKYIYENGMVVDQVEQYDTIEVAGQANIKVYNKYRSLDIPLLLSYEWAGKHGFYFSGNGGILMNFGFNQKGTILSDSTHDPINISSSNPNREEIFETSLGVSLYASLGMYFNLNEHFDLMVEPNIRYNMNSFTKSSYPLSQKYVVPGFLTGLRIKF